MRTFLMSLACMFLLGSCGGGGGNPNPNPPGPPAPVGPNMNGRFEGTMTFKLASVTLLSEVLPFVLLNTGIDRYTYVDSDGSTPGTLTASASGFILDLQTTDAEGTGTYRFAMSLTGALTANSMTGSGDATVTLISGIDSEGLDGLSLDVTFTAQRQGQTPSGSGINLAGDYLLEVEVINMPPGMDGDFSGNVVITQRAPGIYSMEDDPSDPDVFTIVVIGPTWYLLHELLVTEDGSDYVQQWMLSGDVSGNSFSGAGLVSFTAEDTDNAGLDGLELQVTLQAARTN